jgi:crotonobetainyl-CoA:carnitine CoA-transferase CaiB-like acyl-CoA transferase
LTPAPGQLDGLRVLDLGIWRPVPYAAQLLAELGAAVTKVEPPGGDPMRVFPSLYETLNGRKRIVELDLKSDAGRAEVAALMGANDVVMEGFRPGVATRLGVDGAQCRRLNRTVIHCSISGFGQLGPLADAPGHDLNYQAWAGALGGSDDVDQPRGLPVGDLAGGAFAAMAVCAAVARRGLVGSARYDGESIDVSMADVLLTWAGPETGGELTSGDQPGRNFPAYGRFTCADGAIALGIVTEDHFWRALCGALALTDLAALDAAGRAARGDEVRTRVATVIVGRRRDEVVRELLAVGVPVAPVLSRHEAVRHEHFLARGTVDGSGRLGHPVRFGGG